MIIIKERRQRPAPHHVPHRNIHKNDQKAEGRNQPLFKHGDFTVFQCFYVGI